MSDPCNPLDNSPPGSSVHDILQGGILEWVAISFSKWYTEMLIIIIWLIIIANIWFLLSNLPYITFFLEDNLRLYYYGIYFINK